jgi:general nucleoside transport system permease protein
MSKNSLLCEDLSLPEQIDAMEMFHALVPVLDSAVRLAVPLLFACLAGLYAERAGVFDIGLEGKMLVAAFAAGAVAAVSGSSWLGLLAAVFASSGFALLHGFATITHRGNQIVSGVAINIIAAGLTAQLGVTWFQRGGQTPQLEAQSRFLEIELPGAALLRDVPILGGFYSGIVSGHSLLVYLAFLMVPFTWWVIYRTRFGLRLRAVGENPAAADTAGISVAYQRYMAVVCGGVLCGFAGSYLSIAQSSGFIRDMTAGKGFIALAALVFAKWRPFPAMAACLLFGLLDAMNIRLQGTPIPGIGILPVQLMQAVPYVLTVALLAGFIGRAVPPRAGGIPYVKEH